MKRLISIALLILFLVSMTEARMPQKGDYVRIASSSDIIRVYEGKITDINTGLICLNASIIKLNEDYVKNVPVDVCIGLGQIYSLTWPIPQP